MIEPQLILSKAPIVEAICEIECAMPPGIDLEKLKEPAFDLFRGKYPKRQMQLLQENEIEQTGNEAPIITARNGVNALQFLQEDKTQLVQIRRQGFSFNRLAPYTNLDDYLPEIERAWRLFVGLVNPVQIRRVRLRYINRILLPMTEEGLELDEFLKISPRLPDEKALTFVGFFNQHQAIEKATGNHVNIILTAQEPKEDKLPLIFDIDASAARKLETADWAGILETIRSLRNLKNTVFKNTLSEKCLNLYR